MSKNKRRFVAFCFFIFSSHVYALAPWQAIEILHWALACGDKDLLPPLKPKTTSQDHARCLLFKECDPKLGLWEKPFYPVYRDIDGNIFAPELPSSCYLSYGSVFAGIEQAKISQADNCRFDALSRQEAVARVEWAMDCNLGKGSREDLACLVYNNCKRSHGLKEKISYLSFVKSDGENPGYKAWPKSLSSRCLLPEELTQTVLCGVQDYEPKSPTPGMIMSPSPFEIGHDRQGLVYRSLHSENVAACKDVCLDDPICLSWTHYADKSENCHLNLDMAPPRVSTSGNISGVKYREDQFWMEDNFNRPGNDYAIFATKDRMVCHDECAIDEQCRSYSWDVVAGICRLKNLISLERTSDLLFHSGRKATILPFCVEGQRWTEPAPVCKYSTVYLCNRYGQFDVERHIYNPPPPNTPCP